MDSSTKENSNLNRMAEILTTFIAEDQLNMYIRDSQDLSMLQIVLEIKMGLILQGKHDTINLPIDNILRQTFSSDIDKVCLVLQLVLRIQCDDTQYKTLLEYININCININDTQLMNVLKLLKVALDLCDLETRRYTFNKFVETNHFYNVICHLMTTESRSLINFMIIHILPCYFRGNVFGSASILTFIWNKAEETKDLDVLCTLPQHFLPFGTTSFNNLSLVNFDKFWFLLQECLLSSNSVTQKQASFLLNQALHAIKDETNFTTETKVVCWDGDCKVKIQVALQNLCILFDVCREKQLHLIEPSYHLLSSVKKLHSSWLMCIYKILLSHSHNAVSAFAVCDIFKSDCYEDANVFKIIVKHLLPILNKVEFTNNEEIWNEFCQFCQKLDNQRITILLNESARIVWIPSICYQFYSNLLNNVSTPNCQFDYSLFSIIESIMNTIEKLPHKFIRNGCIDLFVNFLEKHLLYKSSNFNEFINLARILKRNKRHFVILENSLVNQAFSKENISEKLCNDGNYYLEEIEIILEAAKLSSCLTEFIFKLFTENKLKSIKIADKVCIFLYLRDEYKKSSFSYFIGRLNNSQEIDEGIIVDLFKELLTILDDEIEIEILCQNCIKLLLNEKSNTPQIQVAFETLNTLLDKNIDLNFEPILTLWKEKFQKGIKNSNPNICISFLHLYCNAEFSKTNQTKLMNSEKVLEIIAIFEKIMDTESNIVIPVIFKKLKNLLNLSNNVDDIILHFLDLSVNKLTELKRTDQFKDAIENFTESVFCNLKICKGNEIILNKSVEIAWKLLEFAKTSDEVAYSLAKHFRCLFNNFNGSIATLFMPVIVELLLFGDILKKDQRAEYTICQQIDKNRNVVIDENNPNFRRSSIRGQTVVVVENILNVLLGNDKTEMADLLTSLLMEKYKVHFNKRYFAHSNIHLQKLRTLQAILIVHNHIKTQKDELIKLLIESLCMESHQINVKFLIQWILIRLLCDDDQCLSVISSKMELTSKVHSSTIIAFVPILYHIALLRNDEEFWINLFEITLPWTMGAHFNLRLYAQEGIKKLYEVACQKHLLAVKQRFKDSAECIIKVLDKTERKIDYVDRYVFDNFNAINDYSLIMIYYYIPKFTNVTVDEYDNYLRMPEFLAEKKFENTFKIEYHVKDKKEISNKSNDNQLCTNLIQKKITPWVESFNNTITERKIGNLIVVASLINKAPNLGGLSRTCEVFGAKQLVLNTRNTIKDHEFQSVSMSSENWVDIIEIKIDDLQSYLLDMKQKEYVIIGAEQTSDSVPLNMFQFPKKCLLLLGNEKEGIPPNLLTLIDCCVEIPQFGVVRSLNVHVAAATFIWEYTKKHVV